MRPKILQLDITNVQEDRALEDPALVALVHQGWALGHGWTKRVVHDDDRVELYLMLLLWPPGPGNQLAVEEREALAALLTNHEDRAHDMTLQMGQQISRLHGTLFMLIGAWTVALLILAGVAWMTFQ